MRGLSLLDVAFLGMATPATTNWASRVVANGGAMPSAGTINAMETFRLGMISAGLDTKMHSLCVFVPDSLIAATTPLFVGIGTDPWTNNNFVGGDLTVEGLMGNATTKYLDSGVQAKSGQAINAGTGNAGLTVVVTETDGNGAGTNIGHQDGVTKQLVLIAGGVFSISGQSFFTSDRSTGGQYSTFPDWNRCGYISGNNVATTISVYVANSLTPHALGGTQAGVTSDPTATNETIFAFCSNVAGTAGGFRAERMSFAAIHDGLSSVESSAFWALILALRNSLGGGTGDPVTNWAARVVASGGAAVSGGTTSALRTFYSGLVTDSLLAKMTVVNAIVPDNLIAAAMPIYWGGGAEVWTNVGPFVGGDLTVNGILGNGSSKIFNTGILTDAVMMGGFSDISAGITMVSFTNPNTAARYNCGVGGSGVSSHFALLFNNTSTTAFGGIWRFDGVNAVVATKPAPAATWTGYLSINRTSASAIALYAASISTAHTSIGTNAGAQTGTVIATYPIFFYALNALGAASGFYDGRDSFFAIHAGLTSGESAAFYARIATLRTSLGGGNP